MAAVSRDIDSGRLLRDAHAHYRAGRRAEAESACLAVLRPDAGNPAALHLLAVLAHDQRRFGPALELARRAVAAAPSVPACHNTLGIVYGALCRWDESAAAFLEATRLDPAHFDGHRNLGVTLGKAGRLEEAVGPLERAAALRPGEPAVWHLLASLHHQRLDLPAAIACRRRLVALRPADAAAQSELLVALHNSPDFTPRQLFEEHLEWARRHADPLSVVSGPLSVVKDPDRPLRIGYLSGDFHEHPAARFLAPVLAARDRSGFLAYAYSDVARPDARTAQLRGLCDGWRDVSGMDDDAVAAAVRADRIDVLVDLAGHMENRLLRVFARRPAPVQVSYLGYPNTTGMACIGYRITDAFHDPPGEADRYYTERLVRLEGCCWCYDPCEPHDPNSPSAEQRRGLPDVGELPALRRGHVTFALFNRLAKVTAPAAAVWARVLGRVPGSRLAVIDLTACGEAAVRRSLGRLGIDPQRVLVFPRRPREQYLELFNEADVALDTFPYAGMTTTCDALWMGVPTVTLLGQTHVSRTGLSLLTAVGLGELAVRTPEEYVETAAARASDLPRLAELRRGLRGRVSRSPLADGARVARGLEGAFRAMWREWCGTRG